MVADKREACGHHCNIGGKSMSQEAVCPAPEAHHDEDCREGEQLTNFDPDIECYQVWQQSVGRNIIVENF